MNIVDIEQALIEIAQKPYNPQELGLEFVAAFAKSSTTVKRLKANTSNVSDIAGGLLWRGYMHYAPAMQGMAGEVLEQLKLSKASVKHKVRLLISTDGHELLVFDRKHSNLLVTSLSPDELSKEPAFFFPLAGLEAFRPSEESIIDIKATGKLAKLYDALIASNPDWESHRHKLNHFMTQIIFCFFSEDSGIFPKDIFAKTLTNRAGKIGEHATAVITAAFTIMDKPEANRNGFEDWEREFPYVNGGLFSGDVYVPNFDNKAFRFLLDASSIDWSQVNPDILGSSIQAIVDPTMRGSLGMHYTSVQNILKTLSPLFLDELREELFKARYNKNKIHVFLDRLSKIKVFDPACGSGNFLVIAYREIRKLEMEALDALRDIDQGASKTFSFMSRVQLSQFYGIEYADFAAETAKLALWIAEHQANSRFKAAFGMSQAALPLKDSGNIICANALRVDWSLFCPTEDAEVKICGNPPYHGSRWMSAYQKEDMRLAAGNRVQKYKALDYVCAWFLNSIDYILSGNAQAAFVSTNSIVQGSHASILWPVIFNAGLEISFGHTSFKWKNNAASNAGVTCVIVGVRKACNLPKIIINDGQAQKVQNINSYLLDSENVTVHASSKTINSLPEMTFGSMPNDGGNLLITSHEYELINQQFPMVLKYLRRFIGADELINGTIRYCIWISDSELHDAMKIPFIRERIEKTRELRMKSNREATRKLAVASHKFGEVRHIESDCVIVIPRVSSEFRAYLPVDMLTNREIISENNFAIYDGEPWLFALLASKMHHIWIATICARLRSDFRYSNTLGWNTFPIPTLSDIDKKHLEQSTKKIIVAREEHYPATIAHLYDPKKMPENLLRAHQENDQLLESLYRKKLFESDQERLKYLFERYTRMVQTK